jgi:hypothetical protein
MGSVASTIRPYRSNTEAAAGKPDLEVMKVTGKGLIEAAQTVAEMVGPVSAAVKG